jgi:hypothetical protein
MIVVNYIDDLIGIAPVHDADRAFNLTLHVLREIGLVIANDKMVAPCIECTCLGIIINTEKQNLCIPTDKLQAVINMCHKYTNCKKISKVQIQSLLGNLIYIHKAVRPAHLFVNRIIALLKVAPERGFAYVGADFKRDLHWFTAFAVLYNGFTKFNKVAKNPDYTVYVDACLSGLGGRCINEVYTLPIEADGQNIAYWEAINVLLALRTWAHFFSVKQYSYIVIM